MLRWKLAVLGLRKKVSECFDRAFAIRFPTVIAALRVDVRADLRHGIPRAGNHGGYGVIEHFKIVMAIADGENPCGWNVETAGYARKAAPFLESPVTEAQVDGIALPTEG